LFAISELSHFADQDPAFPPRQINDSLDGSFDSDAEEQLAEVIHQYYRVMPGSWMDPRSQAKLTRDQEN
jgi:hypothetical protein